MPRRYRLSRALWELVEPAGVVKEIRVTMIRTITQVVVGKQNPWCSLRNLTDGMVRLPFPRVTTPTL